MADGAREQSIASAMGTLEPHPIMRAVTGDAPVTGGQHGVAST
jgi:hypothetical protein